MEDLVNSETRVMEICIAGNDVLYMVCCVYL